MKRSILFLLVLAVGLCACQPEEDSLIGTWAVDKVHVQFDESRVTPELVKQVGEMEKRNTFSINADSTLVFKGLDADWKGRVSLVGDSTLCREGSVFGTWKDGKIVTRTESPVGEVVIIYKKK